jgi:hypothetical protein
MPCTGDGMSRGAERARGVDERLVMPGSGIEIVEDASVYPEGRDPRGGGRRLEARRPDLVGTIEARGESRALRETVVTMAELLGLRVTAERRRRIAALDLGGLRALVVALRRDRRWPPRG